MATFADTSGVTWAGAFTAAGGGMPIDLPASQFNAAQFNRNRFNERFVEPDLSQVQAGFKLRVCVYEPFTGVLKAIYGDDTANSPLQGCSFDFVESGCGAFSVTFITPPHELGIGRGDRVDIHLLGSLQPWFSGRVTTLPGLSTSADKFVYKGHGFFEVLDQIRVTEAYANEPLEAIVADLAATYLAHTDIVFYPDSLPQVGYRVESVEFDRESLKDALSTLAELANGYVFGVDENREFFFKPREGRPSLQYANKTSQWVGHNLGAFELTEKSDKVANKLHIKMGGSADSEDGNFADFVVEDLDSIAFFGSREAVESAPDIKSQTDAEQWAGHHLEQGAWPVITGKAKGLDLRPWVGSKEDLIRAESSMRVSMPRAGLVGPYHEPLAGYYRHQDLGTVLIYGSNRVKRQFSPRLGGMLGRVSILARAVGSPGNVTLAVKKGSTTVATATAAASPWHTWIGFDLADCQVLPSGLYDLEFYASSGDASNYVEVNYCTSDAPFSGAFYTSSNGGTSWSQDTAKGLVYRAYLLHHNEYVLAIKKASYKVGVSGMTADIELGALDQPLEDQILTLLRGLRAQELLTQNNSKGA